MSVDFTDVEVRPKDLYSFLRDHANLTRLVLHLNWADGARRVPPPFTDKLTFPHLKHLGLGGYAQSIVDFISLLDTPALDHISLTGQGMRLPLVRVLILNRFDAHADVHYLSLKSQAPSVSVEA